jgi:hypothetical protein
MQSESRFSSEVPMRFLPALTLFAALVVVGCSTQTASKPVTTPVATVNSEVQVKHTIALKVPDMHCPHGCWPTVQESLAAERGVGTLKLADQANDAAIDNPIVYVGVNDEFSEEHAIAALAEKGFKAETVEK